EPDVEVLITPDDAAAGRDTQLETAVELAMDELDKQPRPALPEVTAGPVKSAARCLPALGRPSTMAQVPDDRRSRPAANAPDLGAHRHVLRRGYRADRRRHLQAAGDGPADRAP